MILKNKLGITDKYLFDDVYEFAGKIRTENITYKVEELKDNE